MSEDGGFVLFDVVPADAAVATEPAVSEADPDMAAAGEVAEVGVPMVAAFPEYGTRCRVAETITDWFFVSVLTVPRFPVPEEFVAEKVRADLSKAEQLTAAELKKLVTPALPDDQLQSLLDAEVSRRKGPRAVIHKALQAEIERRGDGYRQWVEAVAGNPLTNRIAAMAWVTGDGGMIDACCALDDRDEAELLQEFWEQSRSMDLCVWNFSLLNSVRMRSVCLDVPDRRASGMLRMPAFDGTATELSAAMGLTVESVLSQTAVFEAWRDGDLKSLTDAVTNLCEMERRVILAGRTV